MPSVLEFFEKHFATGEPVAIPDALAERLSSVMEAQRDSSDVQYTLADDGSINTVMGSDVSVPSVFENDTVVDDLLAFLGLSHARSDTPEYDAEYLYSGVVKWHDDYDVSATRYHLLVAKTRLNLGYGVANDTFHQYFIENNGLLPSAEERTWEERVKTNKSRMKYYTPLCGRQPITLILVDENHTHCVAATPESQNVKWQGLPAVMYLDISLYDDEDWG